MGPIPRPDLAQRALALARTVNSTRHQKVNDALLPRHNPDTWSWT
jgi:hypothetical protein